MKQILRIFWLLAAAAAVLALTACSSGPAEKDFTVAGLTITLNEEFTETASERFDGCFFSVDTIVTVRRETDAMLADAGYTGTMTAQHYAEIAAGGNELDTEIRERDGLVCFDYDVPADGVSYHCLAVVLRSDDSFWLIHFMCAGELYPLNEAAYLEYAASVTFAE